jgi:hypothetical protein
MRKMFGITGDEDEQPASKSAVHELAWICAQFRGGCLQSNMIAIAMSIMSTWWYPRNGISPTEH